MFNINVMRQVQEEMSYLQKLPAESLQGKAVLYSKSSAYRLIGLLIQAPFIE